MILNAPVDRSFFPPNCLWSESATHPIELLAARLGALLLLEGGEPSSSSCLPRRAAISPLGRVQPGHLG